MILIDFYLLLLSCFVFFNLYYTNIHISHILNVGVIDLSCCVEDCFEFSTGFPTNALKLALINSHFKTAHNLSHYQVFEGKKLEVKPKETISGRLLVLTDKELKRLAIKMENIDLHLLSWKSLATLAGEYSFYFNIFVRLIDEARSVSNILSICVRPFLLALQKRKNDDINLVDRLIHYLCCLEHASISKPWEKIEVLLNI